MFMFEKFWHGLSFKRKLMLFFSIIIIFISLLNLYTLVNAFRYFKIYELDLIKNASIHDIRTSLAENNNAFENYLIYSSESFLTTYTNTIPEIWSKWAKVREVCNTSNEIYFQIKAVRYAFLAYVSSARKTILYKKSDDAAFVPSLLYTRRINGYMEEYLKNLMRLRLEEGSQLYAVQVSRVKIVRMVSFLGIIIFSILSIVFVNLFSNSVTRPIRDLATMSLKMAEGELGIPTYHIPNKDEIGILTESFNKMTSNIEKMVNRLKDKVEIERKLREDELKIGEMSRSLNEAQFLSLQSQINPHFLFNTLNTISRTSLFEKASQTVTLIEALSDILRYTLNKQNRFVPLKEEINILVKYMYIQQTRYGDRLKFVLNDKRGDDEVRIPIFTLQPLVENAVKYGIEPKEEGGTISVSIESGNTLTVITIHDTGLGIQEPKLKELQTRVDEKGGTSSTGIGLANVQRRVQLAYHGKSSFHINSTFGKGTTITIKIPRGLNV